MFYENLKKEIVNLKWFILIYIGFLVLFTWYESTVINFNLRTTSILLLVLILITCFILLFIKKNNLQLYKTAFIIILIFGIITTFITPITTVCDETEHFWRSELTSNGEIFPEYVDIPNTNKTGYEAKGYITIGSMSPLYKLHGKTFYDTNWSYEKINYTPTYVSSSFSQNPFYGYIPQAIGINIAKGLDLSNIWMLWIGRLCNLLFFGLIVSYTIKKVPIFKMALFVCGTMALTIYQAASLSIDSSVNGLAILVIGYFLYMYKSKENSLTYRNIGIFSILTLLCGLTKVTYMGLMFLLFLVPKEKFKTRKISNNRILGFLITVGLNLVWIKFYASHTLLNSWRGTYFLNSNVNATQQLMFLTSNPVRGLNIIFNLPHNWSNISGFFSFGCLPIYTSIFLSLSFIIFYIGFCILYPNNIKLNKKFRLGIFLITFLILFGTYFVQYITWSNVGKLNISGVYGRYFLPLVALGPLILNYNNKKSTKNKDLLVICIMMCFLSGMILLTFMKYY